VSSVGSDTALPAYATPVGFRACRTPLLLYTVGSNLQARALTAHGARTLALGRDAVVAPDGSLVSFAGNRIRYAGGSHVVAHLPLNWKITSVVVSPRDPHAFLVSAQSPEAGVELCGKGLGGIYRVSPTGSKTILVDNPCHDHPQAAWSPDGAAISYVGVERDLYTLDSTGSHLRRIVAGGQVLQYLWSPDGTRIAYATKGGTAAVVALAGRSTRTLGHGAPLAWSPDGRDVAVAATGKPLIEAVSTTGEGSRVLLRLPR
jgi:WD40-like Beta Propeller Repeat